MTEAPSVPETTDLLPAEIVLFDGVCGFCDQAVQWLLRLDTRRRFHYAPLQGETAELVRRTFPEVPLSIDTMVFYERDTRGERVYLRSSAILRICQRLGGPWALTGVFWILPTFLRDGAYGLFARNRYRLFGKKDSCQLPEVEELARFLV